MNMDKSKVLGEIKSFLEGYNNDFKYLVNVEADSNTNVAECVIHEPDTEPRIIKVRYEPFMYMRDLSLLNRQLYEGHSNEYIQSKRDKYGISITKLDTGNQKRLVEGYCYKLTSKYSYNDIVNYVRDGGINPYEKKFNEKGEVLKDKRGLPVYANRDLFYSVRNTEQFFISNKIRLYKGFEQYKDVHKLTFDIETTGLRYQISRIFAIGVRDNRGFETILELDKLNDDESEVRLIQDFFNLIDYIKPAVISGYNSENFDFEFILGRAKLLKMNMCALPTGLKEEIHLKRKPNTSVKYGNTSDKYTATEMWGYSVIDIIHAAKKTAAVNTEIKSTGLKYISRHEKIAKANRTYIKGEDNTIGKFYSENKIFLINDKNEYVRVPLQHQVVAKKLYLLQGNKERITNDKYKELKNTYLSEDIEFVNWFKKDALPNNMINFISGKKILKQYLLDDLWETEQVDELYNQSSFMLAKIVPTTYQRICTMGSAAIWNLLLTTWSYENNLAIPMSDAKKSFSGGLARCYKVGFIKRIKKIDYASLYPMIQLSEGVFPMFDITGVIKKMLLYLTTTRNIYKKLANSDEINKEELELLEHLDHDVYLKYINNEITAEDRAMFKIKQLPIKILNNSLFGALGSSISFNWSDGICAARITCIGRLQLRHAIDFFTNYGCVALLAVTDGINFNYPETTKIRITDDGVFYGDIEGDVDEMWNYGGKTGMDALITKFNKEELKAPYMSVDDDGDSVASLNLSRINYANLVLVKDKKTGLMKEKIKLTGNTIKSKVMPEYIEDFFDKGLEMILHGKGKEFVDYYYDYCDDIRNMQIPLKKIANKSKIKTKIEGYLKRGKDKNGKDKAVQAHMELLIQKRNLIAEELFEKHKDSLNLIKDINKYTIQDKMKAVSIYMPPEPELDSVVYYVNTGYMKSHGDSRKIKDLVTGEERFCAMLISNEDLTNNPNMLGTYNYAKYLGAFNNRVKPLLTGYDPEIQKKILVKIARKDIPTKKILKGDLIKESFTSYDLELKSFNNDDYDESMYLEDAEINFWNAYGYDPRLIWNGFKSKDTNKIYYEIYENALKFLNEKMIETGKPLIKSINDDYSKGDLVLIKNYSEYSVALYNGVYLEILRENVEIPKSEIELELERKKIEIDKNLEKLKLNDLALNEKADVVVELSEQDSLREKHFKAFKKEFHLPKKMTIEELVENEPDALDMLDEFANNMESDGENIEEEEDYSEYYLEFG